MKEEEEVEEEDEEEEGKGVPGASGEGYLVTYGTGFSKMLVTSA